MAAYAFAQIEFKGKTALYLFILLGLMIPPQALIISGFKWIAVLKLISSHWALIFTYFGWASFGILVLRSTFQSIPKEIIDAARIEIFGLPDRFIDHGERTQQLADAGLDVDSLSARVAKRLAAIEPGAQRARLADSA